MSKALDTMKNRDYRGAPVPFTLVFVTADEGNDTGGEIITLTKAVLGKLLKTAPQSDKIHETKVDKRPHQKGNATKRIFCLVTERYYSVHIRLMWQFNDQEICW